MYHFFFKYTTLYVLYRWCFSLSSLLCMMLTVDSPLYLTSVSEVVNRAANTPAVVS